MKKLRVAVVGAGNMGINHLRVYQKRDDIDFVGVVEPDGDRARTISKEYGCKILELEELSGHVDAVSIVTPSNSHHTLGMFLLKKGIHCLIEKPLAVTLEQCKDLTNASNGAVLLVGHVEEYNQGFRHLKKELENSGEHPICISSGRFNYGSKRISDTDVVLDLMIHDVGCITSLLGKDTDLRVIAAHGLGEEHDVVDQATAILGMKTCMITLQASRLSQRRHREFTVSTATKTFVLDYISQQVSTYDKGMLVLATDYPMKHPLECEIDHFIACIHDRTLEPLTSGEKATNALKCVSEIQRKIYHSRGV